MGKERYKRSYQTTSRVLIEKKYILGSGGRKMATYKNPWYVLEISIKLLNTCVPKITKKR